MDINGDIGALIAELDRLRIARAMSYQQLADACGVSKSTIHRTLTCGTEPTVVAPHTGSVDLKCICNADTRKPAKCSCITLACVNHIEGLVNS